MSTSSQLSKYERKAATRHPENDIDKIKLYYFQEEATSLLPHDQRIVLTPIQEEKRKRLTTVWGLLIQKPKNDVIEKIQNDFGITDRQARNIINQSFDLFGNIDKIRKDVARALFIAQREAEIQEIKDDEDLESSDRYKLIDINRSAIEKMRDAYNHDDLSMEEILESLKLPEVRRSTNPDTLDTDHEEVQ
jgi:sulfite reductase alpha subunit-like flavoprotein